MHDIHLDCPKLMACGRIRSPYISRWTHIKVNAVIGWSWHCMWLEYTDCRRSTFAMIKYLVYYGTHFWVATIVVPSNSTTTNLFHQIQETNSHINLIEQDFVAIAPSSTSRVLSNLYEHRHSIKVHNCRQNDLINMFICFWLFMMSTCLWKWKYLYF